MMQRKIDTLQLRLGGIRGMTRLPKLVFVVDTIREATAVKEANILGIPVLALVDSNSDPDDIEHLIPANDDAMRSINLLVTAVADAVLEGSAIRESDLDEEEAEDARAPREGRYTLDPEREPDEDDDDERYLGEATLKKLREAEVFAEESAAKAAAAVAVNKPSPAENKPTTDTENASLPVPDREEMPKDPA